MKKVIVICIIVILLLSGAAVSVLYYIGDRLVNGVIDSELSVVVDEPLPDTQEGTEAAETAQASSEDIKSTEDGLKNNSEEQAPNTGIPEKADGTTGSAGDGEKATKAASNNGSNTTGKPDKGKSEVQIQYTPGQINEVKDQVTATDKIDAAALALKRLTPSDIDELKKMLANGVDAQEKKKAKEIMYQRFTKEEIEIIREMYEKYMND